MPQLEELRELAELIHSGVDAVIKCIEQADYDNLERIVFPPVGEDGLFEFMCAFDELASEEVDTFCGGDTCTCGGAPSYQPCGPACKYPYTDERVQA